MSAKSHHWPATSQGDLKAISNVMWPYATNAATPTTTITLACSIFREYETSMKYHIAKKKIPFVDDSGKR